MDITLTATPIRLAAKESSIRARILDLHFPPLLVHA